MFRLKSGCSLHPSLISSSHGISLGEASLELSEFASHKIFALGRSVRPETALPTDRAGALDTESDNVRRVRRRGQVDVAPGHVGRSIIGEGQEIDRVGPVDTAERHCECNVPIQLIVTVR